MNRPAGQNARALEKSLANARFHVSSLTHLFRRGGDLPAVLSLRRDVFNVENGP